MRLRAEGLHQSLGAQQPATMIQPLERQHAYLQEMDPELPPALSLLQAKLKLVLAPPAGFFQGCSGACDLMLPGVRAAFPP